MAEMMWMEKRAKGEGLVTEMYVGWWVSSQRWVILLEDIQSHMLVVLSVRHNVRRVEDVVGI